MSVTVNLKVWWKKVEKKKILWCCLEAWAVACQKKETGVWQRVIHAVNHVRSGPRTLAEMKKTGLTSKSSTKLYLSWMVYDCISLPLVLHSFACLHYIMMNSELINTSPDRNINLTYVLINDVFLSQPGVSNVSNFHSNLSLNENIALVVSNPPM